MTVSLTGKSADIDLPARVGGVEWNITHEDAFFRGEDQLIHFTVRDADGDAVDIGTWSLAWRLLRHSGVTEYTFEVTDDTINDPADDPLEEPIDQLPGPITLDTDGSDGKLTVTISARVFPETAQAFECQGQLWRTDEGNAQVLWYGSVLVQ